MDTKSPFFLYQISWQFTQIWYNLTEIYIQGGEIVSVVKVGETESLDSAIKRFKRKCQKDGIIGDIKKNQEYLKPSVKKKLKREEARKKNR